MQDLDTDIIPEEVAARGRRYARAWQQNLLNSQSFGIWSHIFETAALSSFEWKNIPDLIDPRYIEICLFNFGMGGFFEMQRDTEMYAFAQATPLGNPNMYYNPQKVQLIPPNGVNQWVRWAYWHVRSLADKSIIVEAPDAIVCYDNIRRVSLKSMLRQYAMRLARIDRICDINFGVQATPYIINTIEERSKDAINLLKQLSGFEPAIVRYKNTDGVQPEVLNLNAPYVADKLIADGSKIVNQALTLLGIDNSNTEKKERVIGEEAGSNDELIMLMRRSRAMCRQQFCEQVNDRFGLDIQCHYAVKHTAEDKTDMSAYDDPETRPEPEDQTTQENQTEDRQEEANDVDNQ